MNTQALFKFGKAAPKPAKTASKPAKTASKPASAPKRTSGGAKKGGWLGTGSGDINLDKWYGPDRALFLPGGLLDRADVPSYLNGTLPGDYGYDPLGLGKDGGVDKYRVNELLHARWAMLATFGALAPEILAVNGADIKGATWFETGAAMLNGGTLSWFAVPFAQIANPLPLFPIIAINTGLMAAVEFYRRNGTGPAGYSPGVGKFDADVFDGVDELYPGGPFDPLGLADDPEVFAELKVKEIKNGRLAMVAALGFIFQALNTHEGPYTNLVKHLGDPFGNNLLTVLGAEDRAAVL